MDSACLCDFGLSSVFPFKEIEVYLTGPHEGAVFTTSSNPDYLLKAPFLNSSTLRISEHINLGETDIKSITWQKVAVIQMCIFLMGVFLFKTILLTYCYYIYTLYPNEFDIKWRSKFFITISLCAYRQ